MSNSSNLEEELFGSSLRAKRKPASTTVEAKVLIGDNLNKGCFYSTMTAAFAAAQNFFHDNKSHDLPAVKF